MKKQKYKVGDIVMTIKGPRIVTSLSNEVVRFEGGFAPNDMVTLIKGS